MPPSPPRKKNLTCTCVGRGEPVPLLDVGFQKCCDGKTTCGAAFPEGWAQLRWESACARADCTTRPTLPVLRGP
eukprot:1304878-Pyramimonas_sp.AAC.1